MFPLFSGLPGELRNQIWRESLPDRVEQALYFYKKGCWGFHELSEGHPHYDPTLSHNLYLEFFHDLLDQIQFEVSLFFVNREARGIALTWIHEQGLKVQFHRDRGSFIFVRPFDPVHDTLYVPSDKWEEFVNEPFDHWSGPIDRNFFCEGTAFARLALPEALLQTMDNLFPDFCYNYFTIKKLFIIVGAQLDIQPEENELKVQRRWEVVSEPHGAAFFWNNDRNRFEWRNSECIDKALGRLIEDAASNELFKEFKRSTWCRFEIQPAFAIRK
ncbi:hypothetical protein FQN49_002565 [Arthroderma sp. PD_2]|nr:hypothetical protein FQN49_002565 [Arthroderma sp. PD_2]